MSIAALLIGTKAKATYRSDGTWEKTMTVYTTAAKGDRLIEAITEHATQQAQLAAAQKQLLLEKK